MQKCTQCNTSYVPKDKTELVNFIQSDPNPHPTEKRDPDPQKNNWIVNSAVEREKNIANMIGKENEIEGRGEDHKAETCK